MKHVGVFLLFSLWVFGASAACDIPVREKSYTKYHQGTYYDLLSLPKSSFADLSISNQYNYLTHFRKKVEAKTSVDQKTLLQKQKVFYKDHPVEVERYNKALQGKVGRLRKISCLEAFLLDNHLRTFSSETEFSAYILTKPEEAQAIVIFYTQLKNGTVSEQVINNQVEVYRRQGWNVEAHLHNHPFSFKNPYGDIAGTTLPSNADVETFRHLRESVRLRSGVVTNGFDSFVFYPNDFKNL